MSMTWTSPDLSFTLSHICFGPPGPFPGFPSYKR